MNKNKSLLVALSLVAVVGVGSLTACAPTLAAAPVVPDAASVAARRATPPAAALSAEEAAGLTFMREEEKLAHDVYLALYDQWQLPIFQNIAASEQTHTEAVLTLLQRYGLPDPAQGAAAGEFADAELQALYDQLVAQGVESLAAALRVGAAIEEIDILDLQERLAQTDQADIQQVYNNLAAGSRNHLRSFVSTLQAQTGETYQPQYLDQATYDAIVAAAPEQGNGGGRRGR